MTSWALPGQMATTHPLFVPSPRVQPHGGIPRRLALGALRRRWRSGSLEFRFGDGSAEFVGPSSQTAAVVNVHNERLFWRLLTRGEIGVGEAYVAGDWSAPDVVAAARAFLRGTGATGVESTWTRIGRIPAWFAHRASANSRWGSQRNVQAHYDLGNAFYRLFLDDDTLAYSAGRWARPEMTLADAQRAKFDRLADLLAISSQDHVLEIGCGWGGMAIHLARTRGCRVTAITVSREQHDLARARVAAAGLTERIEIAYRDYRDVRGRFDKIVSIEMIEAVGHDFLPAYFASCARALRPGGRVALQAITMPDERYAAYRRSVDWMQRYIFPGSHLPSVGALRAASARAGLRWVSATDVGPDYVPTLRAWHRRFDASLPAVRDLGFDIDFIRTWDLYLSFSEAAFAEGTLGLHHIVLESV